ncbi:CHAT domain-containing protein [Embleya sp. NPDC005971]|uniref:CHAT domain-containing protein n=1 Tax=Embleya sp. NPDC005971 TaxID=3156724 RepID=UPI00340D5333
MDDEIRAVDSYIRRELTNVDPRLLILRFDTEYDIPLDHAFPIGLLQMVGAFDPPGAASDLAKTAIRVGAYWCRIVQADVEYDLLLGRRLITESAAWAAWLTEACAGSPTDEDTFAAYAAARWHDGAGRIHYRLGSHGLAVESFKTAEKLAKAAHLWWCLPDLSSNRARGEFELRKTLHKEVAVGDRQTLLDKLTDLHRDVGRVANEHGIEAAHPGRATDVREREFLRGYSNVLHNLATVLRESDDPSRSLEHTIESIAISRALGDHYRIAQSTLNRAFIEKPDALRYFAELAELPWQRGRLIAEQNIAAGRYDLEGLRRLEQLLDAIRGDGFGEALISGVDADYYAYTVRAYGRTIKALLPDASAEFRARLEHDLRTRSLEMARSMRRVVTLPVYKRTYAKTARPVYLERIRYELDLEPAGYEKAFALVEECSARELLDLMANTELPLLEHPEHGHEIGSSQPDEPDPAPAPARGTRAGLVRAAPAGSFRQAVRARSAEFEERFSRHPLQLAPHDPDIAHRLTSFAVNHPGTCVVRYFVEGWDESEGEGIPTGLGAFVSRGTTLTYRRGLSYLEVRGLSEAIASNRELVPTEADAKEIWRLLIAPIWDLVTSDGLPGHLVLVPTDEIFAIPLQVALPDEPGAVPLGAMLPMSLSASVTTYVGRGRHLLKTQAVTGTDDLAVLMGVDPSAGGGELINLKWPKEHFVVAGEPPETIVDAVTRHRGDWSGVRALVDCEPEFFLFVGHGVYDPEAQELGPGLKFGAHYLTQFDVALRLRLPRNKLTVLAACVAGRGMQSQGGDVLGFVRSFIASGAGAVAVPLWDVRDSAMVATVGRLLRASREALDIGGGVFDVVDTLHEHYRELMRHPYETFADRVRDLPLALYL